MKRKNFDFEPLSRPVRGSFAGLLLLLLYATAHVCNAAGIIPPSSYRQADVFVQKETDAPSQTEITGTVRDEKGEGLPGVNILVKGTQTGTTTDAGGRYKIGVPSEGAVLIFSFVGYLSQEIRAGSQKVLDITLAPDQKSLDEVVVVGYGVQKKANVLGAVATITNEQLVASPVSRISNALAGRLPGVIVSQRSGEPGNDEATILIRGKGTLGDQSPLVVVDGIPGRDLNSINPSDIESITVLKDAAAGIYGARAANGVILVVTKRGSNDQPLEFKYDFYQGWSSPTSLPKMADAATYAQMIREVQTYRGSSESNMSYSLSDIEKYRSGEYPWTHPNTNWFEAFLRNYSRINNHNLSLNGGGKNTRYYVSFGRQFDDGIYKASGTSYHRYNLRGTIDFKINEYLSLGLDMHGIQENRMSPTRSSATVFNSLIRGRPTDAAIYPNGFIAPSIPNGTDTGITGTLDAGYADNKHYRMQNVLSATLKIPGIEGLSASGYYAYDLQFDVTKLFQKPWTNYNLDRAAYLAAGNTGKEDGSNYLIAAQMTYPEPRLRDTYADAQTRMLNLKVSYERSFADKHNLSAFFAYENWEWQSKSINAFRRYFVSDALPYLFAGSIEDQSIGSSVSVDARENYFGRISYDYKEKYLFQFSFRRDGSVRFSEKSGRWGNFPSVFAGWRISNEEFWKDNLPFINQFKLRASWGQLGNDAVPAFQYLSTYGFGTGMLFGSDKTAVPGLAQNGTPNPIITWEVANIFNGGFESRFLRNRLLLDLDIFYQRRNNILVKKNASVPDYTGIRLPDENFGVVENRGFEVVLGYNDKVRNWSFGINGNLAFARNRIVEFDEPERNVPWQVRTGYPMGSTLAYRFAGIFRDEEHVNALPHVPGARPGDIIIEDFDGDGKITNDDRILFKKTADPEITYGINFSLAYTNWSLTGLIQGVGNNMRDMSLSLQGVSGNYFDHDAQGRWTPENPNAVKPRAWDRDEEYWRSSYSTDYMFQPGAFARLKNLQLAYSIPRLWQEKNWVKNARIYVSAQNLCLIYSANKYIDPELRGAYTYPLMRVFALGANVTF